MRNFQLIATFDPTEIMHELHRQPDLWKADTYLRDYPQGPFGDTETVFIRFPPASVTELERGTNDQHECIWMDGAIHVPAARRAALWLMGFVGGERLGRVMINKLRPGGQIFPHADTPVHAEYWDRYHIVLQALPGNQFRCDTETVYMPTGSVWHFRNELEHEVVNNSADDRIHIICDVRITSPEAGMLPTVAA